MDLGKAIKEVRKERDLNQTELAVACGITQTALSQIESGNVNPSQTTVEKLCKELGISQPLLYILATEKKDVPSDKVKNFDILYPTVKSLIMQMVGH